MKKTLTMSAIIAAAILTGCKSQGVNETATSVEQLNTQNSLLKKSTNKHAIESFDKITIDDYREAINEGVAQQKANIKAITENTSKPTFLNTIVALDKSGEALSRAVGTFSPLSSSNSNKDLQALDKEISPILSAHSDDIYMNPELFKRVKKFAL